MVNDLDKRVDNVIAKLYSGKEDPRVVVRKRIGGMGWTFNFAHGTSFLLLILVIVACGLPFLLLALRSEPTTMQSMQVLLLSLMLTVGLIFVFSKIGRE